MGFNPFKVVAGFVITAIGGILHSPTLMYMGAGLMLAGITAPEAGLRQRQTGTLTSNRQNPGAALPVVYGATKLGFILNGPRIDPASTNDKDYYVPAVLCHGSRDGYGIASIDEIYFSDRDAFNAGGTPQSPFTTSNAFVQKLLGTTSQNWATTQIDGVSMATNFSTWSSADAGKDVAGCLFKLVYDIDAYSGGVPVFTAKVKGNHVEDTRSEVTGDSTNTTTFTASNNFIACVSTVFAGTNWTAGDRVQVVDSSNNDASWAISTVATNHLVVATTLTDEAAASNVTLKRWAHPDSGGDNPSMCVRDYLLSGVFGVGLSTTDLNEQSFKDAADYCEVQVTNPAATIDRFACNGWLDTSRTMGGCLAELLSSCRGNLAHEGGVFRMIITQAVTATTFKLTEDNIVGDWEFSTPGVDGKVNIVKATYVDPTKNYNAVEAIWPNPGDANAYLTADNNYENHLTMDLPFTDNVYRAEQIIMTQLKESRAGIAVALTATEEALKLQVNDVVPITHSTPGWTSKEFRVMGVGILPNATVRLLLLEYDSTAYTLSAQNTATPGPDSNNPNPWTIAAPTTLVLEASNGVAMTMGDGTYIPRIKVTFTPPSDPYLDHYDVEAKQLGEADFDTWGPMERGREATGFYIGPVTEGADWYVRVRSVNVRSVKSLTWLTGNITPDFNPNVSLTAVVDGFSTAQNTAGPENSDVTLTADASYGYSNLEDANDRATTYTAYYDINATTMASNNFCYAKMYVNDATNSTSWTEVDSNSYDDNDNLTEQTLSWAGALGADWDIRVGLSYDSAPGANTATLTLHGEDHGTNAGVKYNKVT